MLVPEFSGRERSGQMLHDFILEGDARRQRRYAHTLLLVVGIDRSIARDWPGDVLHRVGGCGDHRAVGPANANVTNFRLLARCTVAEDKLAQLLNTGVAL